MFLVGRIADIPSGVGPGSFSSFARSFLMSDRCELDVPLLLCNQNVDLPRVIRRPQQARPSRCNNGGPGRVGAYICGRTASTVEPKHAEAGQIACVG
jgi:hypothetical protein